MHLAHEVIHLLQGLGRGLDEDVDALAQRLELVVGDDDGDLDERVLTKVEPGHLAVDPYQGVRSCHLSAHGPAVYARPSRRSGRAGT